jgi:hypothetical protein
MATSVICLAGREHRETVVYVIEMYLLREGYGQLNGESQGLGPPRHIGMEVTEDRLWWVRGNFKTKAFTLLAVEFIGHCCGQ